MPGFSPAQAAACNGSEAIEDGEVEQVDGPGLVSGAQLAQPLRCRRRRPRGPPIVPTVRSLGGVDEDLVPEAALHPVTVGVDRHGVHVDAPPLTGQLDAGRAPSPP